MAFITIVTGAYKSTYNWGASHCIYIYIYVDAEVSCNYTWSCTSIQLIKIIEILVTAINFLGHTPNSLRSICLYTNLSYIHQVSFLLLTVSLHVYCLQIPHVNQSLFPGIIQSNPIICPMSQLLGKYHYIQVTTIGNIQELQVYTNINNRYHYLISQYTPTTHPISRWVLSSCVTHPIGRRPVNHG